MGLVVNRCWTDVLDPAYHEKHTRLERLADADPSAVRVLALGTSRMEFGLHASLLAQEQGDPGEI